MGELAGVDEATTSSSPVPIHLNNISMEANTQNPLDLRLEVEGPVTTSMRKQDSLSIEEGGESGENNPQDSWLPITESRNGNAWTSTFHLVSSGIGFQALAIPVALAYLGWVWGIVCLSIAFVWQLYTIWLLVRLHESIPPGTRYSRYMQLSVAAFGGKLGKVLGIFPVMYLSGGSCSLLTITGGGAIKLFYQTVISSGAKQLSATEAFLVFIFVAIFTAQFLPNLNSVAKISLLGAITAFSYCTMIWVLSISKGRPQTVAVTHDPSMLTTSEAGRVRSVFSAFGIIALAFRGHNLVLEIQGTMPSSPEHPSHKPMWRGVTASYLVIAFCIFPLAIVGYWAYGNAIVASGGILSAFSQFHGKGTAKSIMGIIYLLEVISCLSSYQIYAMPPFDNLEFRYTSIKNRPCPRWVRSGIRIFFGAVSFFISTAFPFLPQLAPFIGGVALPLTFAYPCFMWIMINKPRRYAAMWCLNWILGCLGVAMSLLCASGGLWNLVARGLDANFFRPR